MIQQIYTQEQLPVNTLEALGLMDKGKPVFGQQDIDALLSGRRTSLVPLENLYLDDVPIAKLNAKFSLSNQGPDGLALLIHPVYKNVRPPSFITPQEAADLEAGKTANIWKVVRGEPDGTQERLVEFDSQTKEYIVTDTKRIEVPDLVNQEYLTPAQKERFRQGREVELTDGTVLQYTATEPQGIRSNRLALIASLIVDGGLSYILYKGLHALLGTKEAANSRKIQSPGFQQALAEVAKQHQPDPSAGLSAGGDRRSGIGR